MILGLRVSLAIITQNVSFPVLELFRQGFRGEVTVKLLPVVCHVDSAFTANSTCWQGVGLPYQCLKTTHVDIMPTRQCRDGVSRREQILMAHKTIVFCGRDTFVIAVGSYTHVTFMAMLIVHLFTDPTNATMVTMKNVPRIVVVQVALGT